MANLKLSLSCIVSGCFKRVEVEVPVGPLPDGWHFSTMRPPSSSEMKAVCPEHAAGEKAHGRLMT